ncbi:MAG: hypothetical protein Q4D29_09440 [Lachnospiraceae bacterium]|nr:hypothetical protein [Lachnospiraceae bacterium]
MKIVLAGYIALEATHKLIFKERPALSCRFSNRFLNLTDEMTGREMLSHDSICKITDVLSSSEVVEISDMGIFGALWDMAERNGTGLVVDLTKISIRQETLEICEWMNVNPYTYPSKGSWLIRTENPYDIVNLFEKSKIVASVIGEETDNNDRIIINQDEIRFLTPIDRLLKDEQGFTNYR